ASNRWCAADVVTNGRQAVNVVVSVSDHYTSRVLAARYGVESRISILCRPHCPAPVVDCSRLLGYSLKDLPFQSVVLEAADLISLINLCQVVQQIVRVCSRLVERPS